MRKLLLHEYAAIALLLALGVYAVIAQPTIPTKLFDVRNGNGVVDAGTTYPQAIVIVFKDKAAKDEMIDAFAAQYGYRATIPDPANPGQTIANPQTKQAFMHRHITAYFRDVAKGAAVATAIDNAKKSAEDAQEQKLPLNN